MEANPTGAVPEVAVIYTTPDATIAALRVAATLGRSWNAPIRLIAQQPPSHAVSQDGPVDRSPVETPAFRARLAREIDARVDVLVCVTRRAADLTRALLRRGSLVVIGGRHSWWPTRPERLRRALEAQGHFVVFVNEAESDHVG
jgi:hypothetical protein